MIIYGCKNSDILPEKIKDIGFDFERPYAIIGNSLPNSDNKVFLALQNLDTKKINIFKFSSDSICSYDSILPKNIQHTPFFNIFIINVDSILLFQEDQILLINNAGIVNKIFILHNGVPTLNPQNGLFYHSNNIYLGNSNKIFNVGNKNERLQYYKKVKPIYQINFKDSNSYIYGIFPINYTKDNLNYFNYFPIICSDNKNQILLSYTSDDSIYLYEQNKKIKSIFCKSKYIDNFKPYPDEMAMDMAYFKNFLLTEPRYTNLIFNPMRNEYYRIVKHRIMNGNFQPGNTEKISWSVLVMDSTYIVLKEVLFDLREYSSQIVIPCLEGVYISKNANSKNDKLTLTLFKL